jgi:hypothetical protein
LKHRKEGGEYVRVFLSGRNAFSALIHGQILMRHEYKGERTMTENEKEMIEKLVDDAEIILEEDYEKKDLKEKRGLTKQTLYDGSKKLKHTIPKGKQLK